MERAERKSVVYMDLESTRTCVEAAGSSIGAFSEKLMGVARAHGRILAAVAYGDIDGDDARDLKRAGFEARLTSEDGEGSAPESIAIALDAMEALCRGPMVESTFIVSDDAQLGELVRRLRRQGRYVAIVTPSSYVMQEPARSADRAVSLEAVIAGEVEAEVPAAESVRAAPREMVRARPPNGQTIDFNTYDWTRLVLLLRDLEAKMPFVGMRWLKNKVIGPHNVGAVTIADKQLLLNKAVDDGILETYRVGNRDETGDPVTACRLVRTNERVKATLDANPAPLHTPVATPIVQAPAVVEVSPEA
jgi:hypothetical protein